MKRALGWLKLRLFLTYPDVVEVSDDLLEFDWDVNVDVLIKAGLHRTELRQGREVVGARFK